MFRHVVSAIAFARNSRTFSFARRYNARMEERDLVADLTREGFSRIFVWEDGPNTDYPEHTHRSETAHVVLSGEMTITTDGKSATYHAGDRCDVPFGMKHSAKMGPAGCRYLVGER